MNTLKNLFLIILPSILLFSVSCKKNNIEFVPDFSFEYISDNKVRFSNQSEGEYYSLTWDFGNGQTETTTDKKETFDIYYPQAGDYTVSLKLSNYTGDIQTIEKIVSISVTDLSVSFTATPDPVDPNIIHLSNTTQGEYDTFKWIYRNREVENQSEYQAYFPLAGNYEIILSVMKDNMETRVSKNMTIAADDPDYLDHFTLLWSDEFDGTAVNENNWTFETGATGWGNNELQNYTDGDNAEVTGGQLIITAEKVNDNYEVGSYTSSRLTSRGKKEFQYGIMEFRAQLPSGVGIWPALWMLGSNFPTAGWPACGEMDIMEYVGYVPNTVYSTIHTPAGYGGSSTGNSITVTTCEEDFHTYGMIWNEREIVFYVDSYDNVVFTYNPTTKTLENWPFDQPAFFIMNVAVGGNWGGAQGIDNGIFPQSMTIDYVRVYQESL